MTTIAPFRALRFDAAAGGGPARTSAPADEPPGEEGSDPSVHGLLREGAPGPRRFAGARAALDAWSADGTLVEDDLPGLWLYEQHELRAGVPRVQRGVIGAVDVAEVGRSLLLHEDVEPARVADRVARVEAVPVDVTPVVALHVARPPGLAALLERARTAGPAVALTDAEGVDHRLWAIADPALVEAVADAYAGTQAVLADGHHRLAAARELADRAATPADGWRWTLTWLVDALDDGPELRAVHRLVVDAAAIPPSGAPDIPGFAAHDWSDGLRALERVVADVPGLAFGLVTTAGAWLLRAERADALRTAAAAGRSALADLDAQVASHAVLPALAGREATAVFDAAGAARTLEVGDALVVLPPPTAAQVLAIARAGETMPAKTTWFRPKPRAGLVMRRVDRPVVPSGRSGVQ